MFRTKAKGFAGLAVIAVLALSLAACGDDDDSGDSGDSGDGGSGDATAKVGVILPDTTTSPRWENNDRPSLQAAFDAAGVDSKIENAGGDVAKFGSICDSMINEGVNVLMIVNLDSESGAACLEQGEGCRHPQHRLRPPDPGRRRFLLRVVRQRGGRPADG